MRVNKADWLIRVDDEDRILPWFLDCTLFPVNLLLIETDQSVDEVDQSSVQIQYEPHHEVHSLD